MVLRPIRPIIYLSGILRRLKMHVTQLHCFLLRISIYMYVVPISMESTQYLSDMICSLPLKKTKYDIGMIRVWFKYD